ncbi:MAG: glycosyltransferase [Thermoprotei archaeon]
MRVITVARVEPSKRPYDFLAVAEKVRSKRGPVEFVWVGDGTMRIKMIEAVKSTGLDTVKFVGRLAEGEKIRLMRQSDVYVSTSESEGFALTPGEAFLAGLPVVVYDLPVYTEVYDDFPLKARMFDVDDFSEKVILALDKPDWLLIKVAEAKRFVEENYTYSSVGLKATEALRKILKLG